MSLLQKLGFDEEFDATLAETRRKLMVRIVLSGAILAFSAPVVGLKAAAIWAGVIGLGEAWLWAATSDAALERNRVRARAERLLASLLISTGWLIMAMFYWSSNQETERLMAVALLGGVILYLQKACEKTPIHLMACMTVPAVTLVALPFTYLHAGLVQFLALESGMVLLLGFGLMSAFEGYRASRRLKAATAELVGQREAAQAASRAKTEFLANMSHEIRTPLNCVVGVIDVLSRTPLDPAQQDMVRLVRESGVTLERLLSDVLDLARVESGRVEIQQRPFHLGAAVRASADLLAMKAEDKGIDLKVRIAPEAGIEVDGDEVRLKQILGNLLSNAVKFTEAGEVEFSVDPVTDDRGLTGFRFAVRDSGVGFEPADKERLFGRFEQADGSITRRFGGSGLGLSISRQLAELMGGALDCEGEPGVGATFTVVLPLAPTATPTAQAPEPVVSNQSPADRHLKVLLADDHPVNRKVVELILDGAGVELTSVEHGLEALEAFKASAFDLVLMDMQMPVMDGLSAVRAIRAHEAQADSRTPIIMLTANALPEHEAAAAAAGADGHLAKPIPSATLLAAIRERTAPAAPASAAA